MRTSGSAELKILKFYVHEPYSLVIENLSVDGTIMYNSMWAAVPSSAWGKVLPSSSHHPRTIPAKGVGSVFKCGLLVFTGRRVY